MVRPICSMGWRTVVSDGRMTLPGSDAIEPCDGDILRESRRRQRPGRP